jgi:hypothetical protein
LSLRFLRHYNAHSLSNWISGSDFFVGNILSLAVARRNSVQGMKIRAWSKPAMTITTKHFNKVEVTNPRLNTRQLTARIVEKPALRTDPAIVFIPKARALNAINTMAGSVLKAGFSTILAVSCLVFSRGLVTSTLLKCFVVMVIAGLLHALIFMPCTLFLLATASERMFPTKKSDPEIQLESE